MEIMTIKIETLFGDDYFEGFIPVNEIDYQSRILKNFEWMERNAAENNPLYKQPIAYTVIVNPNLKQVFIYKRSSKNAMYPEKRLQGNYSWGLGGHIEKLDIGNENPIITSRLRELKEEVEIKGRVVINPLGFINNDTNDVGKVHFGILYIIETDATVIKSKNPEIESGALMPLEEIDKIFLSKFPVDEWSRIAFNPLKSYLRNL